MDRNQQARLALNEATVRELNEGETPIGGTLHVECECFRPDCRERLSLPIAEYERVRGDSLLFVVLPGHSDLRLEDVVEEHDGYDVLRKKEEGATVARATDPR